MFIFVSYYIIKCLYHFVVIVLKKSYYKSNTSCSKSKYRKKPQVRSSAGHAELLDVLIVKILGFRLLIKLLFC